MTAFYCELTGRPHGTTPCPFCQLMGMLFGPPPANAMLSDWTSAAAREICEYAKDAEGEPGEPTTTVIQAIINKHCPFSPDVVYEEVVPKDPPLLQCSDCGNTESPAGAMARVFNRGRCMFCAGYFKVVRG